MLRGTHRTTWQHVHALVLNSKTVLSCLLIITGMAIRSGWVVFSHHYNSREHAAELIDGGDMSSCWNDTIWGEERTDGQKYGPEYYSQRGEDCPPRLDNTLQEYLSDSEEYSYIFRDGEWVCYDMNEFNDNDPELTTIPTGALAV